MFIQKPYSPRMTVSLTPLVMVWLASSACSQEYSPVIEDRVESGLVQAPVIESDPGPKPSGGWDLGVVVSAAYNDNIFLSSSNPESDMVFRVAPIVAYTKGNATEGEGWFVKGGYRPTLVVYASHGSENRVDQQALLVAGWRGKVTRVTYSGGVEKLGDATAETGRPTDRLDFQNEIRVAWIPREKVTLEAAVGDTESDYSDPAYYDSGKTYGEVTARYAYSPKTEIGLAYQVGRVRVEDSPNQDTQQLTAQVAWAPREKFRVAINVGAEHRRVDGQSDVNPVLEGGVYWSPRKGTDLYLTGYMREEVSVFYAGQNYSVRGFTAGISQRLNHEWTAKLEGGYEKDCYQQVSGSGTSGRRDNIWFLRPALVYQLSDESDLSLYYRISGDDSNEQDFGYSQQILGVELNHIF